VTVPASDEDNNVNIVAQDGDNVKISCKLYSSNGTLLHTSWKISTGGAPETLTFSADASRIGVSPYNFISGAEEPFSLGNLSITFMQSYDRMRLICNDEVVFTIGIAGPPSLEDPSADPIYVTESVNYNVTISVNDSYPPINTYTWTFNDQQITDDTIMVTMMPTMSQITFMPTKRVHSGVYTLTASNGHGTDQVSFTLDVQYPPGGDVVDRKRYFLLGDTITLTAFKNFDSNPSPFINRWLDAQGNNITINGRYTEVFNDTVQLTIRNLSASDNGMWTFGAANAIGNSSININLVLAVKPGPPINVTESDVTENEITLKFDPPESYGDPPLTHYRVIIRPPPLSDVTLSTNKTIITITDLIPSTVYNITVAGVSDYYDQGDESDVISVMTSPGPPEIKEATAIPTNNGNIDIDWGLRHTGGLTADDIHIRAYCRPSSMPSATSNDSIIRMVGVLSHACNGTDDGCIDDDYKGSASLGPTRAGEKYSCVLIVEGDEGVEKQFTNILSETGIPSVPKFIKFEVSPDQDVLRLTVSSRWAGLSEDNTNMMFKVIVDGGEAQVYAFSDYSDNKSVIIDIPIRDGSYTIDEISVSAVNMVGSSDAANIGPIRVENPSMMPSTRPTLPSLNVGAIVGGVVGGALLIIIIAVAIAVVVAVVVDKTKKKTFTVSPIKTKSFVV
jgi:hypothetical protein